MGVNYVKTMEKTYRVNLVNRLWKVSQVVGSGPSPPSMQSHGRCVREFKLMPKAGRSDMEVRPVLN